MSNNSALIVRFFWLEGRGAYSSKIHRKRSRRFAFTIIELLVVMVVISVLITIAIPRIQGLKEEANQVKALAETRALAAAIESYYLNQSLNTYPATTTTICASVLNNAKPLILDDVLVDPFSTGGAEYNYFRSNNGRFYVVFSVGNDTAADISGIDDAGRLQGTIDDDIFWTNGTGP
ncbi:MAG: type II secretion system protein [Candidatus Omnitrophica bacterium]|nr:type II secretion system protein [Candidatus Omnitrophota bacterium]